MKRDIIDTLLQLAYLEGKITTHGGYEQSVARKKPAVRVSAAARNALQKKLAASLAAKGAAEEVPLTVGAYLRSVRGDQSLPAGDVFERLGLPRNIYRMLEQDRISPLKVGVEVWKKLRTLFNLPGEVLGEMIRRTHQLVFFSPAFRTTLARYDSRKNRRMKASTLEKAAQEMFVRAKLELPEEEEKKLSDLLKAIQ
jgi:hypothetical protein